MICACRCIPHLAGRQRTTCCLCYSDEGPGDGGAYAASRKRHAAVPMFQGSRAAEERVSYCFSGLRNFGKFSFQKYSWWPAVTRLRPSLSHLQRPAVTRHGPSHLCSLCNSLQPDQSPRQRRPAITSSTASDGWHSQRCYCPSYWALPATNRRCPSNLQRPVVHHPPRPASLAAAIVTRATESVTVSVTRCRPTDSVTRHCHCDKAEVCVIVQIWNTLTAKFGAQLSPYIMYIRK